MKFLKCSISEVPELKKGSIAIVGAGPAGLAAAGYLACKGYSVTVYDQMPEPGGLLLFGIPEYRVPKAGIRKAIKELEESGVVFKTRTLVYANSPQQDYPSYIIKQITSTLEFESLIRDYDAVLLATGAWKPRSLGIPGENLEGVYKAFYWLIGFNLVRQGYISEQELPPVNGVLLVIGGGHTAVDALEVPLKYYGTRITRAYLSYRRTRYQAPMGVEEFERLIKTYHVEPLELTIPIRFEGTRHVEKVVLQKTKLVESQGKLKPVPVPGTEFSLDVDVVLIAVGEKPSPPLHHTMYGIEVDNGWVKLVKGHQTTNPKVFAAGDLVLGPSRIGYALQEGVKAAEEIHNYLSRGRLD